MNEFLHIQPFYLSITEEDGAYTSSARDLKGCHITCKCILILCGVGVNEWQDVLDFWWRKDLKLFSALLALCEENPLDTCEISSQWASNAGLFVFSLIYAWANNWTKSVIDGVLRRHNVHVAPMQCTGHILSGHHPIYDAKQWLVKTIWNLVIHL